MALLQHIRSLFARREPRKVVVDGIGEVREDGRGWWTGGIWLPARKDGIGATFNTGAQPPGAREAAFWQQVSDAWPELWPKCLTELRRELFFHSPTDADAFFSAVHPMGCRFRDLSPGDERWEMSDTRGECDQALAYSRRNLTRSSLTSSGCSC